jgi:hypothetical protein
MFEIGKINRVKMKLVISLTEKEVDMWPSYGAVQNEKSFKRVMKECSVGEVTCDPKS